MTPEFESQHPRPHLKEDLPALNTGDTNQSIGAMDMHNRDRFELLSAYLDGEVTAAERRQVEDWLANEPGVQCLYERLLKLRQGLRTMPVPPAQQPIEGTVGQVLARVNKRPKMAVVWGGSAIAAVFIGALSGVIPIHQSPLQQLAQVPQPAAKPETLMVALNTPVVEIPKAPASPPGKSVKPTQSPQPPTNQNVY
jgi:anti-sigma factor RsiW